MGSLNPNRGNNEPLVLFYGRLHDAIREELGVILNLANEFLSGDAHRPGRSTQGYSPVMEILKTKYRFLEFVYKYHSTIEDEVLYPALEKKIKNVTLAYSVEHEDEEYLLEGLSVLLAQSCESLKDIEGNGDLHEERTGPIVHGLARKVEEVNTTLRKHLEKEEEQLMPMLRDQFTIPEQSDLVMQFLCCVPISGMTRMLKWLFRSLGQEAQQGLLEEVKAVVREPLLKDILEHVWLSCQNPMQPSSSGHFRGVRMCCGGEARKKSVHHEENRNVMPLKKLVYFHEAIRSAMQSFADEAKSLLNDPSSNLQSNVDHLRALAERHRFIRTVCHFHASAEDDILFPFLRDLVGSAENGEGQTDILSHHCEEDHVAETARFEALGRLLGDVRSCARRGAKELSNLMRELSGTAEKLSRSMHAHMAEEESDVFPMLMKSLCPVEQRLVVWKIVQAMPLRLLERFMPWISGKVSHGEMEEWLSDMNAAALQENSLEKCLVELLSQWAHRSMVNDTPSDNPAVFPIKTCGPQLDGGDDLPENYQRPKRIRTGSVSNRGTADGNILNCLDVAGSADTPEANDGPIVLNNPIDHIFQFHKALKSELKDLERASMELQRAAAAAEDWSSESSLNCLISDIQARFQFLRGIYKAHSRAEDEIVFPALESKEKLSNVSHAYSLDHKQEERLLEDVSSVVMDIDSCATRLDLAELRSSASKLSKKCAAIRASLETHVRAEEKELWPLFSEHFSIQEQEELVGKIIGQTGAEVLQVMLSWVTKSMTEDESNAMMMSFKTASKSTAFESWLDAYEKSSVPNDTTECVGAQKGNNLSPGDSLQEHQAILAEVAAYLSKHNMISGGVSYQKKDSNFLESEPASLDATRFRPGWKEIFRMNQKHLQAAIRRVSADDSLEPQRKAYLIQHLMASRYIVAQQMRNPALGTAQTPPSRSKLTGTEPAGSPEGMNEPVYDNSNTSGLLKSYYNESKGTLGCKHYARKAILVAPCCEQEVVCRLCHDEKHIDHKMDRYQVREMRCMECGHRQTIGQTCSNCGIELAKYYCGICHLLDDDPCKEIYHCPFCNFCRRGKGLGIDSFHCMSCNCCMSLELRKHDCSDNALSGTCPVCSERLFESNTPVKALPCGHFMHSLCFGAYVKYSYTCPICFKSLGDMEVYWKMLDAILAADQQQLPKDLPLLEKSQTIRCYDCEQDSRVPFHFVYHKCRHCKGYNTKVVER
jgi:zinc finger-like protein